MFNVLIRTLNSFNMRVAQCGDASKCGKLRGPKKGNIDECFKGTTGKGSGKPAASAAATKAIVGPEEVWDKKFGKTNMIRQDQFEKYMHGLFGGRMPKECSGPSSHLKKAWHLFGAHESIPGTGMTAATTGIKRETWVRNYQTVV